MKKLTVLLFVILAICMALPVAAQEEICFFEREEYLAPHSGKDYFDKILDIEEFSEYLHAELPKFKPTIDIRKFDIPFSKSAELYTLLDDIVADCFYAKIVNIYGIQNREITELEITYLCDKSEVASYQAVWDKTVAEMLEGLDHPSLTDVQKALIIHDRIVLHCEYDIENLNNDTVPPESYTPFGVIVKGIAVCQGYAETYSYLLHQVGIESYLCNSQELFHTWNIVKIDGEYYYVDVTFDDPVPDGTGRVFHNNFLCSYDEFEESHKARDYDRTPDDERYDDAFWRDTNSSFQLVNGEIYFIDYEDSCIKKFDGTSVLEIDAVWYAFENSGARWPGIYTRLAARGNKLYYSYPKEIRSYNTINGKEETVFTPEHDFKDESHPTYTFNIYYFRIKDGKFVCELDSSPNYSKENAKKYIVVGDMPDLDKFNVKFDANGGQSAPGTQQKTESTPLILTENVPVMDGYSFEGWSTTPNGKVEYLPGGKYLKDEDVTLYAVWKKVIINVTDVALDLTATAIYRGETLKLNATVYPKNATNKNLIWSSSDTRIATVDENGTVKAIASGKVTVTVTTEDGGKSAECEISISKKVASKIKLTVGNASATAGNTVTVDVSVSDNPGVADLEFALSYNSSVLTLMDCKVEAGTPFTTDFGKGKPGAPINVSLDSKKDFEKNGRILTLTFEIKKEAEAGEYDLSIKVSEAENEEDTKVEWVIGNGRVSVVEYKPGDLSGDGEITTSDAVALAQSIAGWGVQINKDAADCNGDGMVNTADAVLLCQYIAGWAVKLVFAKK